MATMPSNVQLFARISGMIDLLEEHPSRRRRDTLLIRICVGLSLLLVLFYWFDVSAIVKKLFAIDAAFLALALVLLTLQFAVSCVRWLMILGRQRSAVGPRTGLSIFGMGTLANIFLVTSLAGISVRAALLLRAGVGFRGALAPLLAERVAALVGLAICGAAGVVFALPDLKVFMSEFVAPSVAMSAFALFVAVLAIATAASWNSKWVSDFIRDVTSAFATPGQAAQLIGASVAIVLLGFAGMAALATGMGLSIDLMFFLSVMPAVAFLSALPISIGGWGVREGAMVAGLSIYSIPPDAAMALSISYGLGGLLVALLLGTALAMLGTRS